MAKRKRPTIGEHIKALRESRGLTQEQLATAAGTTKNTVWRIESGAVQPTWESVLALAAALGVGVERFTADSLAE